MKSTFHFVLIIFSLWTGSCYANDSEQKAILWNDPFVKESIYKFQDAFNHADSTAIKSWSVTQPFYDKILSSLLSSDVTCLTEFDKTYSVRVVLDDFNLACKSAAGFIMDSIAPVKSSILEGCGGVSYKRLDAKVFMKNSKTSIELPLTLIFLKEGEENKLMMQIINYKILQNEQ